METKDTIEGYLSYTPKKKPTNCLDCPHHLTVNDPQPGEIWASADCAVLCRKTANDNFGTYWESGFAFEHKAICVNTRSYFLRENCNTPKWCPL